MDDSAFIEYIKSEDRVFDDEEYRNVQQWTDFLYKEYERMFWNHMHSIIFGPDAYRAFKQQKNYLMNKIIKPFGVTVDAAFPRVDAIVTLLPYFPSPAFRGKPATAEQWESFEGDLKVTTSEKKEMKYNLLPESYHDRFDALETDWNAMSMSLFLSEAQKCEAADKKEQAKIAEGKAALKKKKASSDEASTSGSGLSRSSKSTNSKTKKRRTFSSASTAGKARFCVLCKMAGAPDFVYTSHNTDACNKKDEYQKKLSGSAGSRKQAPREYKRSEEKQAKELKLLQKRLKKLEEGRKQRKSKDESSVSSMDTDVSLWLDNITVHWGETMKNYHFLPSKKSKIDKIVNPKLNILDSIINVDLNNKKLSNDVHKENGLNDISKNSKKMNRHQLHWSM